MSRDGHGKVERGEAVLAIFKRGADFMKQLMDDNETLRKELASVESRQQTAARDPGDWEGLRQELLSRISELEEENQSILEQLRSVENENQQFAERYLEIEEENNNLANLYVASYQLHSTLDPTEVLKVILEIVINLIGAERFAIYIADERTRALQPVACEGDTLASFPSATIGEGIVGETVASGETYCSDPSAAPDPRKPIVCIPLRLEDRPIGAIAIYALLQQKEGFTPLDHELFTLLGGHAATGIFAAQLYGLSERKLNTIQGFIDLLTK